MAPITNAKKCYRCRQRHGDRYRKADLLRKKHNTVTMKTNDAVANEFCLKLQREKKREYRKRVSLEISQNQLLNSSSSSTSSFSNKAVKGRSLKKACDALPKSPRNRSEIVQSLSEKLSLSINLATKKLGQPVKELSADKTEWLLEFMEKDDVTYTNPGRKDQRYIGKENGKSKFVPIRYLLWTLRDLLEMVNGCSLVVEDGFDSFSDIFLKKLTFRQLYHFIKSRKQFVYNRDIPQASCLCEICENTVYLAKSIASRVKMNYHANPHSLVETYSCDTASENCMNSVCMNCRETGLKVEDFDDEDDAVVFYKWKRVDNKVQKIEMSLSPVEACTCFDEEVRVLFC